MAILSMPTFRTIQDHKYNIVLDGDTFIIEFHLNRRADRWNINVFDVENNPVRHGVRLVEGINLLQRVVLANRPDGELTVVDPTGAGIEPIEDNFGNETSFRYIEESSL